MLLEVLLSAMGWVGGFARVVFVACVFLSALSALGYFFARAEVISRETEEHRSEYRTNALIEWRGWVELWKQMRVWALHCLLIATPFSLLPTVNSLWETRIALIKFHLASPENVQKGAEEIGRIAKKLECKYLGCEEDKPKGDK